MVLSVLSNDLDIAHLKKFKHLESNMLDHPIATKVSAGQWNVLKINCKWWFGESLSKLDHWLYIQKNAGQ